MHFFFFPFIFRSSTTRIFRPCMHLLLSTVLSATRQKAKHAPNSATYNKTIHNNMLFMHTSSHSRILFVCVIRMFVWGTGKAVHESACLHGCECARARVASTASVHFRTHHTLTSHAPHKQAARYTYHLPANQQHTCHIDMHIYIEHSARKH